MCWTTRLLISAVVVVCLPTGFGVGRVENVSAQASAVAREGHAELPGVRIHEATA